MPNIELHIFSPQAFNTAGSLQLLFEIWEQHIPDLMPEKYGHYGPGTHRFRLDQIENLLRDDAFLVFLRRRRPNLDASISWRMKVEKASNFQHSQIEMLVKSNSLQVERLMGFFIDAATTFNADFGLIHIVNEHDVQFGLQSETVFRDGDRAGEHRICMGAGILQQYVPDLYWCTFFGPAYIDMFGIMRLFKAPGYSVASLAGDGVLLQLTEHCTDSLEKPELFEAARTAAKRHLNTNAFFDPIHGTGHAYNVPEFSWKE